MKLSDYVKEHSTQAQLCKSVGVTQGMVSQWVTGRRPVAVEKCYAVESATGGLVMRWDLRPNDWWLIWPELLGRKDAPKLTTAA